MVYMYIIERTIYLVTDCDQCLLLCIIMLIWYYTYRSTPVETLHTILLGPCKYLLHKLMASLSKKELHAQLQAFPLSGIDEKVLGNLTRNYRSFVGRDFKAWIQVGHVVQLL